MFLAVGRAATLQDRYFVTPSIPDPYLCTAYLSDRVATDHWCDEVSVNIKTMSRVATGWELNCDDMNEYKTAEL
jgi:hypothetical protein